MLHKHPNATWTILVLVFLMLVSCGPAATRTAQPEPPATSAVVTTSEPEVTAPLAFLLAGKWTSTAKNGDFVMQATIILEQECQVGQKNAAASTWQTSLVQAALRS